MERCGFFDANLVGEEYDRVYLASQFAAYFASFIGNGVFAEHSNQLQVMEMATPQMQIGVERGQAWINGYWYENTDMLYLPIDVADGVLNRIDSIVLRLGFSERNMWLAVKKGTPAINPIAPEVTRNADYYELQLATISIPAGSIKITQAQITDTRMNQDVCGWVTGVIDQVDTTTLFNQYVDWYTTTTGQAEADIEVIKQQFQAEFNAWFVGIKDILDESVAGNLLNLIEGHKNDTNNPHNVTTEQIGAETPVGSQAKANTAEANAKAYTDAHEQKAAPHSGHETPTGAQAKANAALNSAKQYTDQEVGEVSQALTSHTSVSASTSAKGHVQLINSVSSTSTTTAATPNSVKQTYDKANAALPKSGGTMTGILTAHSNTSYTIRQVRNIILSTADADVGAMQNGDIWIKYK